MNISQTITGQYFDGVTPVAVPAKLTFLENRVELATDDIRKTFSVDVVEVSPRTGSAARFIRMGDEGQFQSPDEPLLDRLRQEVPSEGIVAWLENRIGVAVVGALVLMASLGLGYVYGIPYLAGVVVERVPMQVEWRLGEYILDMMDEQGLLQPSEVSSQQQGEIDSALHRLLSEKEMASYIQVEFRKSPFFGANAFALPGGLVIITDDLVDRLATNMEIVAVLAHEAGHVHYRHGMQSLLQKSLVGLVVATVTADINTTSTLVASYPVLIMENAYSRNFEYAADDYAAMVLVENGFSPGILANALEKIDRQQNRNFTTFTLFSTHPETGDRVSRLAGEGPGQEKPAGW